MEERHHKLLSEIVRAHVAAGEPVGSKALEGRLGVSSATIRNDMADLEQAGFLAQPHTSAGRIPTVKGYQYYVDNLMEPKEPKAAEQKSLREVLKQAGSEAEASAKELAKQLAHFAGDAAVIGFSKDYTYYTGLANLFSQPEFKDIASVVAMGKVIDHLDEALRQLMPQASDDVTVRLGSNNPFGDDCAVVYRAMPLGRHQVLVGLLGPVRMDYDSNVGRLTYVGRFLA